MLSTLQTVPTPVFLFSFPIVLCVCFFKSPGELLTVAFPPHVNTEQQ